ncbi:hypothetical protein NDU88_006763 [Pleurodeles waltl]|uniref:Uncharacterized protein n=1 Tax=Pleurodeles waltl TaxID=8319 RepID=A0AAV7N1Z0_PLEWA|nr:hypothetical protein NDU88_006763 [Pleurodeles waltl]
MGRHRRTEASQRNTMEQYTTPVALPQRTARSEESDKALYENCKISIYPDYTNKVQNSRKGFMEVKAKLRAMSIRYMHLYPARLKVLSGGKAHFFEGPEEVWRWLEMWDKVAPVDRRGSEASPDGPLARRARTEDHMFLSTLRSLATGFGYSGMPQWRWCLLTQMGAQPESRTWRWAGVPG